MPKRSLDSSSSSASSRSRSSSAGAKQASKKANTQGARKRVERVEDIEHMMGGMSMCKKCRESSPKTEARLRVQAADQHYKHHRTQANLGKLTEAVRHAKRLGLNPSELRS